MSELYHGVPQRIPQRHVAHTPDFQGGRKRTSFHEVVHRLRFDPFFGFTLPTENGPEIKAYSSASRRYYRHLNERPKPVDRNQRWRWEQRHKTAEAASANPRIIATLRAYKQGFD